MLPNGSLAISFISGEDEGVYRCVAMNKAGQEGQEINVVVNGSDSSEGEDLHAETTPITKVEPTPPNNNNSNNVDNITKSLSNSSSSRNCVEYKDISFGPNPEREIPTSDLSIPEKLSAVEEEEPLDRPPYFTSLSPQCVQSLVGYRIVLNCLAGGTPRPNITWEKDGAELNLSVYNVRK